MVTLPPGTSPRTAPRQPIPTSAFCDQRGLDLGDASTLRVLRALHRRNQVLGLVDDALTPGGRVVQLVLTTYGPIATHSVWHEHGLNSAEIRELAAAARDNARLTDQVLAAVGLTVPVMPVVVVWGPDEFNVPSGGRVRHDVMFLRGSELKPWLKGYLNRGDAFSQADATELMVRLQGANTSSQAG